MKVRAFDWILWLVTILLCAGIFMMPHVVPIHWNGQWEIDGYGSRYWVFLLAFLPIFVYYGMSLTKHIDPKRMNLEKRQKTYRIFQCGLTVFFIILAIFFEYMIFNPQGDIEIFIWLMMSLLLIGMGNYLPKVPQNYFFGIKTPWTLASEYVWKKTHKISGYCFVMIGLINGISALIHFSYTYLILMIGIIGMTVFIYVYSYFLFRKCSQKIDD